MTQVFAGFLFLMLPIKFIIFFNGAPLPLDPVGYALLLLGANQLAKKSPCMGRVQAWIACLLIFSIFRSVWRFYAEEVSAIHFSEPLVFLAGLIYVWIGLYASYLIITGLSGLEWSEAIPLGADVLLRIWKIQAFLRTICCFLPRIQLDSVAVLVQAVKLAALVSDILFLMQLYRVTRRYCSSISPPTRTDWWT